MRVDQRVFGPALVVSPSGTIDLPASGALQPRLLAALETAGATPPLLLVDMARVPFVSSAGLRMLMIVAKRVEAAHGRLAVASLSADVAEIFRIARFDLVVRIFDTPREALAWMSPDAAAAWDRP